MMADIKKRSSVIEKLARVVEKGKKTATELIMENDLLRRRLMIYDNANSPPAHGSVPAQQKKARSAKGIKPSEWAEGKTVGIPGRRPGHTLPISWFCLVVRICPKTFTLFNLRDFWVFSGMKTAETTED